METNMAIRVVTTGRRDLEDYFRMCLGQMGPWGLNPVLAFKPVDASVVVEVVLKPGSSIIFIKSSRAILAVSEARNFWTLKGLLI